MREQLLPDSKGLILQKTRSTPRCVYTGERIEKSVHAISLKQRLEGRDGTYSCIAWLSIGAIDDLSVLLDRFDPGEHDPSPKVELSPGELVKYGRVGGHNQTCLICDEAFELGDEGLLFINTSGNGDFLWAHLDCRHRIAEGVNRVWEFSDELLAEQV